MSNDIVDGMAADPAGDVYVSTTHSGGTFALEKYAAGITGTPTPEASIALNDPTGVGQVAIDGAGNVYVTLIGSTEVAEFNSSLSTQLATLSGSNTGLSAGINGSLAADGSGNLYVGTGPGTGGAGAPNTGIAAFAPLAAGSNNVAPTRTLSAVGFTSEIAVDSADDIFFDAAGRDSVTEYPAGAGTTPQSFSWPGGTNGVNNGAAYGFAISHGQLYVSWGGAEAQSNPPTPAWYSFNLANPNATPVPFMTNAPVTPLITSY
jgi:hypothetical protein